HRDALVSRKALDGAPNSAAKLEAPRRLRLIVRIMHVQNDRYAWRRRIAENRVVEKSERMRNAVADGVLRRRIRLRDIEVLTLERTQDVIGQLGLTRIRGAF